MNQFNEFQIIFINYHKITLNRKDFYYFQMN